jgi:hypothetical protein
MNSFIFRRGNKMVFKYKTKYLKEIRKKGRSEKGKHEGSGIEAA